MAKRGLTVLSPVKRAAEMVLKRVAR